MSLLLRESATAWGDLRLKNNDVIFEIDEPASHRVPVVYATQRELDRSAREFSARTEFAWNAFVYFVDPDHKTDLSYIEAAKFYYHIHMIATLIAGKGLLITKLLPKSGHDKNNSRINLADAPLPDWDKLVADMSQRTRITVERFRIHYVEWDLIRQEH